MKLFHSLVWKSSNFLFAISLVVAFLMMTHVTADVVSRTLFNYPLPGTGEITASWYMVLVAFLPFGWITLRDSHVTADIFTSSMPRPMSRIAEVFADLLGIAYVGTFVWQTWISALKQTKRGEAWEIFGGYLPVWPMRWVLPIAGGVMVAALVLRLLARLTGDGQPASEST